jgi:hypothetical protein
MLEAAEEALLTAEATREEAEDARLATLFRLISSSSSSSRKEREELTRWSQLLQHC